MIVAKKTYDTNYAVFNNNALAPKRHERYDDYIDINKKAKEKVKTDVKSKVKAKPKTSAKSKLRLVAFVLTMFCMGTLVVARYAMIMEMNNQVRNIKTEISEAQKENESLNLKLLQFYDIKQIEKEATSELSMVRPKIQDTIVVSLPAEYETMAENNQQPKVVSMLDKIANMLN
ncbi:cell division protein FtsL [Oxobacter pfennigii]|uniref:Cell division protein FtsL n=1 Tax=Oxobacter pfennigii TaxID=36849 RepID=A0A0P8W5S5_9CLOT|nr:cell division protein FtsL [Oxobacter pfennigii]KPU44043.1 cell division protein FtsL [Oxobacter pfennigii]